MADEKPPRRPPPGGGIRPPDFIHSMALARVEDLMLQCYSPREIFAKVCSEGYTDSEDTCAKWRREVTKRWAAEDAEQRPARKDAWRMRLEEAYRTLLDRAATCKSDYAAASFYGEAIKVAKIAIVMDGLTVPIQVNHTGTVDIAAMTPVEREKEIAELLAKRQAAQSRPVKREPGLLS